MKELLKTKGFKMTPQRELIFSAFFELGEHVSVDELYAKVREVDESVGYSTVWRNLKLICRVGLAEEVNIGDGVTRYDRVTHDPHGHLYCRECKQFFEFDSEAVVDLMSAVADRQGFRPEGFKVEIDGVCRQCLRKSKKDNRNGRSGRSRTDAEKASGQAKG
ncbi:MAG: transcriptional repressor [candidate division Zixibacteria bacterium]|nr:transcriptional repressor [candidate division Zixibacteria bacterium]